MFNLEQSIADWRKQMLASGIKSPVPLEELESHLREEIERRVKSGMDARDAFGSAFKTIGWPGQIGREFNKIGQVNWNRHLARTAWALFIVSLLLPAYGNGARGWQCAGLSATAVSWMSGFWGNWMSIHFALLTLANVAMVVSFFWLSFFSHRLSSLKWPRITLFAAFILVWSFIFISIINGGAKDLLVGCYAWTLSFLVLFLSVCKIPGRKTPAVQYV